MQKKSTLREEPLMRCHLGKKSDTNRHKNEFPIDPVLD